MSKMSDLDIQLKEIETRIDTLEQVCHAIYETIIQLVTTVGDNAHDRSFTETRLMHSMGAMYDGLVPCEDDKEETEEDNVVPLFDEDKE